MRRLRIDHIWPLLVMATVAITTGRQSVSLTDYWFHVAVGRQIWETGAIPTVDTFSHSAAGLAYPSYQRFWLADLAMYATHRAGGVVLAVELTALIVLVAYGLLLWLVARDFGPRVAAVVTALAAWLGFYNWNTRPQTIAFLFVVVVMVALQQYRRSQRWAWLVLVPVTMLVWENCHGSFPVGLALIAAWGVQELADLRVRIAVRSAEGVPDASRPRSSGKPSRVWWAFGTLALSTAAAFVTPGGLGATMDYFRTITANSVIQDSIAEWRPPTLGTPIGWLFYTAFFLVVLVLILSRRRPSLEELVLFVGFGLLAIRYVRGIVWFGLVLAPVVARHLSGLAKRRPVPDAGPDGGSAVAKWLNVAIALVVVGSATLVQPVLAPLSPLAPTEAALMPDVPSAAVDYLRAHVPPGRLFNSMALGSYLDWAAPGYPVFVDSRIELYPQQVWRDHAAVVAGTEGWQGILDRYQVSAIVLARDFDPAMIPRLKATPGWSVAYEDSLAVVLTRA